jgi:hypothetical protein
MNVIGVSRPPWLGRPIIKFKFFIYYSDLYIYIYKYIIYIYICDLFLLYGNYIEPGIFSPRQIKDFLDLKIGFLCYYNYKLINKAY